MPAVMTAPAKAVKKTAKKETPQYSADTYKTWYTTMYRIRRFEERVLALPVHRPRCQAVLEAPDPALRDPRG